MLKAPINSCINGDLDIQYKDQTFSGYKKTQVFQELKKSILKGEIDKACFWASELDVSCYTFDIWNKLLLFAAKEINYANPRLPPYLYKRYTEVLREATKWTKYEMRNSQELRNRLCEFICILCLSPKKKFPDYPKIKENDFKIFNMKKRMIAKNQNLIKGIVHNGNTIEVKIALNEFANYLHLKTSSTDAIKNCLFWLDWITFYNKLYKKTHGQELTCVELYHHSDIDPKYKDNVIWYIWDIIFHILDKVETRHSDTSYRYLRENIDNLYSLYIFNITKGNMNVRVVYIKYAILLLKNDIGTHQYNNAPSHLDELCIKACANVNELYMFLHGNHLQYKYQLREEKILEEIKYAPQQIITAEDYRQRSEQNHERDVTSRQVNKYIQNRKYGKERLEDEIQRLQTDGRTSYERYIDNLGVIDKLAADSNREGTDDKHLYKQLQKEKMRKQDEKRKLVRMAHHDRFINANPKRRMRHVYRNLIK